METRAAKQTIHVRIELGLPNLQGNNTSITRRKNSRRRGWGESKAKYLSESGKGSSSNTRWHFTLGLDLRSEDIMTYRGEFILRFGTSTPARI